MNENVFGLLAGIGKCHRLLKNHAKELRSRSVVSTVTHWFDIATLADEWLRFGKVVEAGECRVEEFVDAELVNGEALSWRLEMTVRPDVIKIESEVQRINGEGENLVETIADCEYCDVQECSEAIIEVTRKLCNCNPI